MESKHFRKREAVLECLRSTTTHPSAEWVYEHVRTQIPNISLATVYRNLTLFKEQGKVISVGTVNGVERFDGNTEPHVHFLCTQCGAVLDLHKLRIPEELNQAAAADCGGQINGCQLTFTGLCADCLQNKKTESA